MVVIIAILWDCWRQCVPKPLFSANHQSMLDLSLNHVPCLIVSYFPSCLQQNQWYVCVLILLNVCFRTVNSPRTATIFILLNTNSSVARAVGPQKVFVKWMHIYMYKWIHESLYRFLCHDSKNLREIKLFPLIRWQVAIAGRKTSRESSERITGPLRVIRGSNLSPACLLALHATVSEQKENYTNLQFSWFQGFTTQLVLFRSRLMCCLTWCDLGRAEWKLTLRDPRLPDNNPERMSRLSNNKVF